MKKQRRKHTAEFKARVALEAIKCGQRPCICKKRVKIKVKLADGKERIIEHMRATTFWSPDGKPMSATQFIERLFGELPELFKDEDELRAVWSKPDTRKRLLSGLEEKGYGQEQLSEIRSLISAKKSELQSAMHLARCLATRKAPVRREYRNSHLPTTLLRSFGIRNRKI